MTKHNTNVNRCILTCLWIHNISITHNTATRLNFINMLSLIDYYICLFGASCRRLIYASSAALDVSLAVGELGNMLVWGLVSEINLCKLGCYLDVSLAVGELGNMTS